MPIDQDPEDNSDKSISRSPKSKVIASLLRELAQIVEKNPSLFNEIEVDLSGIKKAKMTRNSRKNSGGSQGSRKKQEQVGLNPSDIYQKDGPDGLRSQLMTHNETQLRKIALQYKLLQSKDIKSKTKSDLIYLIIERVKQRMEKGKVFETIDEPDKI
jgi:hypothetical protein